MEYYPVQKRYGDETYDVREFITPDSYEVGALAQMMDTSSKKNFIQSSWIWVLRNIQYPYFDKANADISDRHYSENYLIKTSLLKTLGNFFLTGSLSGFARIAITGAISGGAVALIRDALIGSGLYSIAIALINGEQNKLQPARSYTQYDFWNFPSETLRDGIGDCEDTSILLCSILRNMLSSDEVFVTVGLFADYGHAWVTVINEKGQPLTLETTGSNVITFDESLLENLPYQPIFRFNDEKVIELYPGQSFIINEKNKTTEYSKIKEMGKYYGLKRRIFEI